MCPICGKVGILSKKWGSKIYYPKVASVYVEIPRLKGEYWTGERYRGTIDDSKTFDKNSCFKIRYKKYKQWFIAHYEPGIGRKTHSLRKGIHYEDPYGTNRLPILRKPTIRVYQRKKDLRRKDNLDEKISEIKNNGISNIRHPWKRGKKYRAYLY